MTKVLLKTNTVAYTELTPDEVRFYLSDGSKTGAIRGFEDEAATKPIYIAVHAIVVVYR